MYRKREVPNPKIFGQVRDVEGSLWDVRDIRDTKHGFDLLFGSPVSRLGAYRGGLPRLIATEPLFKFWDANRTKHDGIIYDLPAGRSTLKRVRRRLGFNYLDDISEFWQQHIEELATLKPRDFAARYGLDTHVVSETRRKLLGRRARDLGWWTHPSSLQVLQSGITLREMGEKLNISTSHSFRLRNRARPQIAA